MKKVYDRDTKIAYIEQIEAGKKSVRKAAKELGVTEATIYNLRSQLRADPAHGLPGNGHQKPDVEYQKKLENENIQQKRRLNF